MGIPSPFFREKSKVLPGAKLTAWELQQEGIDYSIIADNAAGHFMKNKDINLAIA